MSWSNRLYRMLEDVRNFTFLNAYLLEFHPTGVVKISSNGLQIWMRRKAIRIPESSKECIMDLLRKCSALFRASRYPGGSRSAKEKELFQLATHIDAVCAALQSYQPFSTGPFPRSDAVATFSFLEWPEVTDQTKQDIEISERIDAIADWYGRVTHPNAAGHFFDPGTLTLLLGSGGVAVAFIRAARDVIVQWLKNRAGRSFSIELDGVSINVRGSADIDAVLARLEERERQPPGQSPSSKERDTTLLK
jgi:hypothetical protein